MHKDNERVGTNRLMAQVAWRLVRKAQLHRTNAPTSVFDSVDAVGTLAYWILITSIMAAASRNKKPRNAEAQTLGDVLHQLIARMGIRRKLDEARMIDAWGELAGPQVVAVTDSVWVKGGKMFVKITSSTWRHELHLQRLQWKVKLNEHLEGDFVDEIIFR